MASFSHSSALLVSSAIRAAFWAFSSRSDFTSSSKVVAVRTGGVKVGAEDGLGFALLPSAGVEGCCALGGVGFSTFS